MKRLGCFLISIIIVWAALPAAAAEEPDYAGKSYVLMDAATGTVLAAHNEHEALAPASVTKVMTLLLIMEAIDGGQIAWTDTVTASASAAAKGGSQVFLKAGETMSVEDMVKSIAVSSANDCACAMAEHLAGSESAFVDRMNARAAELGMNDTHFVNCTGLDDDPAAAAHKTSAHDIAVMSRELLTCHPDIKKYTTIWMDSIRGGTFGLSNTNRLVRFYPDCTGLKTGFTAAAGYCLSASASRNGLELIAVVMGAETSQDRFDACRGMLDYGFANFALYTPEVPADAAVPVRLGHADSVSAVPGSMPELLVKKAEIASITAEVILLPELTAPVHAGDEIGELVIRSGDQVLSRVPMVAGAAVERLSWLDLFSLVLQRAVGAA